MELELLPMELPTMELDIMEWLTMELTIYQLDMGQAMEHPSPLWGVDLGNERISVCCKLNNFKVQSII